LLEPIDSFVKLENNTLIRKVSRRGKHENLFVKIASEKLTGYVMPRRDPSSYMSCKDDRYSLENYENDVFGVFIYF
jgi:hypothetical protein